MYLDGFRRDPEHLTLRKELRAICNSIIDACKNHAMAKAVMKTKDARYASGFLARTHDYPDQVIDCVAEAAFLMEDPALFEDAALHVSDALPWKVFYELGKKFMGKNHESWHASYVVL